MKVVVRSVFSSPDSVRRLPPLCRRRLKTGAGRRLVSGDSLGANAASSAEELSCFGPEVDWL